MFTNTLHDLLGDIDEAANREGWGQPAALLELTLEAPPAGLTIATGVHTVLTGHPVTALWSTLPTLDDEAVGAALVTEANGFPTGAKSPVELRLSQLVLRDGTELAVYHPRGGELCAVDEPGGWTSWLLRRAVGLSSHADAPRPDLALRLVLLWQAATLLAVGDLDRVFARSTPDWREWGQFCIPTVGELGPAGREPWWEPVEACLDALHAGELHVASTALVGLADPIRSALAAGAQILPTGFPLVRGCDQVFLDARQAAWADDALLVAFVDEAIPELDDVVERATEVLPRSLADSLKRATASWAV